MPAISTSEANSRGLAVHLSIDGGFRTYSLYNASDLLRMMRDPENEHMTMKSRLLYAVELSMLAMIALKKPEYGEVYDALEVANSAAEKGYGPLIYQIAMSKERGLISDRESVSDKAKNVWSKFKSDTSVKKLKIDDIDDPQTPEQVDDGQVYDEENSPLNYAYFAKFPNVEQLFSNNNIALNALVDAGLSKFEMNRLFNQASMSFFDMRNDNG